MARTFVKANPDKIEYNGTSPVDQNFNLTFAGWCYPDVAGQTMMICGIGSGASGAGVTRIGLINTNRAFAQCQEDSGATTASITGTTATTTNQWQHVAATFTAIVTPCVVTVYYNGAADGTVSANTLRPSATRTSIGETPGNVGAGSRAWSGALAEIGMWEVALTAAEIAALAKGYSPALIRPTALRFYAPLVRDILEVRKGTSLTATGTSATNAHPRIYAAAGLL